MMWALRISYYTFYREFADPPWLCLLVSITSSVSLNRLNHAFLSGIRFPNKIPAQPNIKTKRSFEYDVYFDYTNLQFNVILVFVHN